MFKPYDFNVFDMTEMRDGASPLPLTLDAAIRFESAIDFGAPISLSTQPTEASALRVIEGSIASILAQAAVNAMVADGHTYAAADGCCACGHGHGEALAIKAAMNELTQQLQDMMDTGLVPLTVEGLVSAVTEATGLTAMDMSSAVDALAKAYSKAIAPLANEPDGGDLPGNSSTTASVEVGGSVTGTRGGPGDTDWFSVDLVAGQEYVFIMLRSGDNPHEDPLMALYDGGGTFIEENDDVDINGDGSGENRNSMIFFTPETSGTYFIEASGWSTTSGDYTIYVEESDQRPDFTVEEVAFFLTSQFDNFEAWAQDVISYDVSGLASGAQTLALAAMELWAEASGLSFVAAAPGTTADLTFNDDNDDDGGQQAFARSITDGNGTIIRAEVTVSENWDVTNGEPDYDINSYRFQTFIHEVGHALGLGHSGPYNGISTFTQPDGSVRSYNVYNQDAWNYTVMSYFDQGEAGTGTGRLALGLQMADIYAIQSVYGVNTETRSDDTVYGFNSTEEGVLDFENTFFANGIRPPALAIYDAGGTDTLDFSGYSANQTISLVAGTFSSIGNNTLGRADEALVDNLSIALGTVIENAVGGDGDDVFLGNDVDNVFTGNGGDDVFNGGAGVDTVVYSTAQANFAISTETVDGVLYLVLRTPGEGRDLINLADVEFVNFGGSDMVAARALTDLGDVVFTEEADDIFATGADETLLALGGDDRVDGAGGNDFIDGGAGADVLLGNMGNDTLVGDVASSLTGVEGEIFRAYQAVFNRDPDLGGFDLFTGQLRIGAMSQLDVIAEFTTSPEFADTYGSLSNREFVELLYDNVLPGNTDETGRAAFTAALDNEERTRAEVVQEFANSGEFIALTRLESAAFGEIVTLNPVEFQVFRLYQAVFDRAPDAGGFALFRDAIQFNILSPEQVVQDFVASAEFQDTYGELDNAAFVNTLFGNVLPDNNDTSGQTAFVAALDNGDLTRAQVVLELANSGEFRGRTEAAAQTYIAAADAAAASDVLEGGTGDDLLLGLGGVDTFRFTGNDIGDDVILDFDLGVDQIDFVAVSGFDSFTDVQEAATQVGADTVIALPDGGSITLRNVALLELSEGDILFGGIGAAAEKADDTTDVASGSDKDPLGPVVSELPTDALPDLAEFAVLAPDFPITDGGLGDTLLMSALGEYVTGMDMLGNQGFMQSPAFDALYFDAL